MKTYLIVTLLLVLTLQQGVISNCDVPDITSQFCYTCKTGYQIIDGKCDNCAQGYTLVNSQCIASAAVSPAKSAVSDSNITASGAQYSNPDFQAFLKNPINFPLLYSVYLKQKETTSPISINPSQSSKQVFMPFFVKPSTQTASSQTASTSNIPSNCKTVDPSNSSKCTQCNLGFYYNKEHSKCQLCNPKCKTVSADNTCISCYPGYVLKSGDCSLTLNLVEALSGKTTPVSNAGGVVPLTTQTSSLSVEKIPLVSVVKDMNCAILNSVGNCISCKSGYYPTVGSGTCSHVDVNCVSWDKTNGICFQCFMNYIPVDTTCVLGPYVTKMDNEGQLYTQCEYRYVFINTECIQVSQLCETWDQKTGGCITCILGYVRVNDVCYPF